MEPKDHFNEALIIFVEEHLINAANASALSWDPDTGGGDTFGAVRLSPDGTEPMTYTVARTLVTDEMDTDIVDNLTGGPLEAVYRESEGWDFQSALGDMGLQRITDTAPGE